MKIIALFLVYFTFAFSANGKDNVLTISLVDPVEEIYLSNVQIHSKDDHIYIGITDENGNIKIKKDKLPAFIELSKDGYLKLIYDVSKVRSYVEISLKKMAVQTLPVIETTLTTNKLSEEKSDKTLPVIKLFEIISSDTNHYNDTTNEEAYFQGTSDEEASNKALSIFIQTNLNYPRYAIEHNLTGKVYLQLSIEADGSISKTEVVRGARPCLDREAIRVISIMPKWVPGKSNGKNVFTYYRFPLNFALE